MKKFLIPEEGKFYKANLHCHSTVSDGELTPAEIKEMYLENGYSAVAFTDHNHFVTHNELTGENFVALNGVENGVDETHRGRWYNKCCDVCYIALSDERKEHPLQPELTEGDAGYSPMPCEYSTENINAMIARGRENGFFVTYNHPTWSLEDYSRYMTYEGMHAMEIYNYSSAVDGYDEYNARAYDDILRSGKRLFCISTDDNHNRAPGTAHFDSFGGYVMIKADKLTYGALTDALVKGNFYSVHKPVPQKGEAPRIKALWMDTEDSSVHIECENTVKIVCTRAGRRLRCINASEMNGEFIDEAKISLNPEDTYLRITLYDEYGNTADTNAYFIDGLKPEINKNLFVE